MTMSTGRALITVIGFILVFAAMIYFGYKVIYGFAVDIPEKKAALDKANLELENVQKYGCANPTVMSGLVMCP